MFLRCKVRRKDGKQHRYWSVVENTRVAGTTLPRAYTDRGSPGGAELPARPDQELARRELRHIRMGDDTFWHTWCAERCSVDLFRRRDPCEQLCRPLVCRFQDRDRWWRGSGAGR